MGREGKRKTGNCDNLLLPLLMSEDVLIQIFLWLPVISLLRFKSVCKSWRAIIINPFFIHLHATGGGGVNSVVFNSGLEHKEEEKRDNIFKLSGEEFEVFEDLGKPPLMDLVEELEVLMNKYKFLSIIFSMVGCCNGIICLHDYFSRKIILWNPAIKQYRTLPKPSNLLGNNCWDKSYPNDDEDGDVEDFVMFGIDVKTKDYKVLLLTTLKPSPYYDSDYDDDYQEKLFMRRPSPPERRAHVYSLSTDSWRCIDATLSADHPYLQINRHVNEGHYLNGSHFFMASYQIKVQEDFYGYHYMPLIMSFDFTEEIFRTIQPPIDLKERYSTGCSNYFIPFGEKLALAVDAPTDLAVHTTIGRSKLEWDVWVLNEQHGDGVKESWTKFYYTFGNSHREMGLRCIANNGQFAIIYHPVHVDPHSNSSYPSNVLIGFPSIIHWKFLLLNLVTGETKEIQSDCHSQGQFDLSVITYKPSLVQIGRSGATTIEKCDDGTL